MATDTTNHAARRLLTAVLAAGYHSVEDFIRHLHADPLADTVVLPPRTAAAESRRPKHARED
ncbi:hypothetical protein ACFYTQ_34230 [Nocardia sp. NPDC004068]|uniref:hypothetical protein n=1 Tax=Nocardia sp. NPDC004068 TaxID=3364303 RepID=UPI0036884AA1